MIASHVVGAVVLGWSACFRDGDGVDSRRPVRTFAGSVQPETCAAFGNETEPQC
jgi:hypothetical protein